MTSGADLIILSQFDRDPNIDESEPPDAAKIYPGFKNTKCKHQRNCKHLDNENGKSICARPGIHLSVHSPDRYVCCIPGAGIYNTGLHYCNLIPKGFYCMGGAECANGACGHPGIVSKHKICCPTNESYYHAEDARFFCRGAKKGSKCRSDAGCTTDNCTLGVCGPKKPSKWEDVKWVLLGILAFAIVIMIIVLAAKF